ncbi:unnamed protein product, partial [Effrenium voratum]
QVNIACFHGLARERLVPGFPFAMAGPDISSQEVALAADEGFCIPDEDAAAAKSQEAVDVTAQRELLGDAALLTEDQLNSLYKLKEPAKYAKMKLKRVSLSFSGASVFFFTPYRADGVPMPASVMKFDSKECVEDEMAKTEKFRSLFGSTTPKVNDFYLVEGEGPCSVMQIDLCGGVFGLPEFAKAPPVQTFASILEEEFSQLSHTVDIIPILNEALERRMFHFTMSARTVKELKLADTYKLVRFVGHGILNRAKEGAKRGAKNPALAAGFENPKEIDDLDPEGKMVMELTGKKQTVRELFQKFAGMEQKLSESLQRRVVCGLCHNDLHGGNLLVDSQGLVWLIDFATVKDGQHVLMDLSKFLSACVFMYLQDAAEEKHLQVLGQILSTTPDATTDLPVAFLNDAENDKMAKFLFQIVSRLRYCMCIFESGPGSPENDGLPFAIALFSWSARMLSYSEPSLYQKTRALYWTILGMQRVLYAIGEDVGPTGCKWIEEKIALWEGQKGRRISTSVATEKLAVAAYTFELELPTYLAQAGGAEAWCSDILTREKVNVTEHCVTLNLKMQGGLNPRAIQLIPPAERLYELVKPIYSRFAPGLLSNVFFRGRVIIIGDAGSGKSVLTKQVFAAIAQDQVKAVQALQDKPKKKDEQGRNIPPKLDLAMVPIRVPLIDLSRQIEENPDSVVEADTLNDLLAVWIGRHYGQDSNIQHLISDTRNAVMELMEGAYEGTTQGLFLLLDGLDEASTRRAVILKYIASLLQNESLHFPMITSRPGVLGMYENDIMSAAGFVSISLSRLAIQDSVELSTGMLTRMGSEKPMVEDITKIIKNPAYVALTGNPLCLTLLVHVLRKWHTDSAGVSSEAILKKTDVYQKAFKLMLHQSDAAKFMSRDNASDQELIRHISNLKSTAGRKFYQRIGWEGHSSRKRAMTLEDLKTICHDETIWTSFSEMVKQGRLPVFQPVEGRGEQMYQLAHLSFQEMLAAEYMSSVFRYSTKTCQMRQYLNFMASSNKTVGRERLSENWWLQTWLHVGEMLEEGIFQEWVNCLRDDDRCVLKVGRVVHFEHFFRDLANLFIVEKKKRTQEEIDFVRRTMWMRVAWYDEERHLVQLETCPPFSWRHKLAWKFLGVLDKPLTAAHVGWQCEGVNVLATEAARLGDVALMSALTNMGVHYSVQTPMTWSPLLCCIMYPLWNGTRFLVEHKADINYSHDWRISVNIQRRQRWTHPEALTLQRPLTSCTQLHRVILGGALLEAYQGTLAIADDLDVNLVHARSGMSLLMCAAAGGHVSLAEKLLAKGALVNARTSENCCALSFAIDCLSDEEESLKMMRVLLDARANVHVKCGNLQKMVASMSSSTGNWGKLMM